MEVLEVIQPGPFTTVQDLGRYRYQRFGVPVSGALDGFSHRVANWLVGNPAEAATLEMTFMGGRFRFLAPALVAVCGAEMAPRLDGESRPTWTSFQVQAGQVLSFSAARRGVRAYLALAGGILVPPVMGSRSTYVGGGLGGFKGRPLAAGDRLEAAETGTAPDGRSLPAELRPSLGGEITLRALPGPQDDFFDQGLEIFFGSTYQVTPQSDRMGCRLEGPRVELKESMPQSIVSEPSVAGGVQVPPNGQPIILLVEQTVGGYAKIATVVSADLDAVAQARPGDAVRFQRVELEQARRLYREYHERLQQARRALGA